jgi:hypothetical protein
MTAEIFSTFVRRLLFAFLLLVMVAVGTHAHGQGAGTVGIYTGNLTVFTSQAVSGSSGGTWECGGSPTPIACPVFPDHGYATNVLTFCNASFTGSIDLEWSPTGSSTYIPVSIATFGSIDSNCHKLQVGGYYPNLRATVVRTAGSVSAWYTASAAPISVFPAAVGTNGATSPISCDGNVTLSITNGSTTYLNVTALNAGDLVNICNFTLSFAATPGTGTVALGWATTSGCSSPTNNFVINTLASTPQTLIFPAPQNLRPPGGIASGNTFACLTNNSGATLQVSLGSASVNSL